MDTLLSVVVPAFNEEASISITVNEIMAAIPPDMTCELVLVSDGSSDSTAVRMFELKSSLGIPIVVVPRLRNGGLGAALNSGFEAASGHWVTWIPGDGEYKLGEILRPYLQDPPLLTSLYFRTNRIHATRNLVSRVMYSMIWVLFRVRTNDFCGIFLIPRQTFLDLRISSKGSVFALELMIKLQQGSFAFQRKTINWHPRSAGRSKVFSLRGLTHSTIQLLLLRFRLSGLGKQWEN